MFKRVHAAGRAYNKAARDLELEQVGVFFGHFGFLQANNSLNGKIGDNFVLVGFFEWGQ